MGLLRSRFVLLLTAVLSFFAIPAADSPAATAINCHCFQDRIYNPAARFAADEYILATSFNSLLSRSFEIPKSRVVMLKMKEGVGQNDLLIGLQISQTCGKDLQQLLAARRRGQPWSKIIRGLNGIPDVQKDQLLEIMSADIPTDKAAAGVADKLLVDFFQVPAAVIAGYRESGLREQEIALLLILAHAEDQPPAALLALRNNGGKSWSEIADGLGVEPATAGKLILQYPVKKLEE
jgi:hypothetical protein